jgi:alpha-L-fucosidase
MKYEDFANMFLCEKLDFDEWMKTALSIGATYVIFTARHHDGYCLWDTKTTSNNSMQTGPKRNLLKEFQTSAKKHGLKFGIYYSWSEFHTGVTIKYFNDIISPQMEELRKYNPDIWWFDGHWSLKTKFAMAKTVEICEDLKTENKEVEINDRVGDTKVSTFRSFCDRYMPTQKPTFKWEHINTIGYSWGRNRDQKEEHYKTGKELYELYKKVKDLGGNFLINLGPNADGTLDKFEVNSLKEFGEKLKENSLKEFGEKLKENDV